MRSMTQYRSELLNRVVEKPHNFDPTGGRKILLDFVVEKSQKF